MTVVQTSLLSYRQLERIGSKQRACNDSIKRQGSASNYDVAEDLNWPVNRVTPRVKELREMALVQEAYKSLHPITDRRVIYWQVTEGGD